MEVTIVCPTHGRAGEVRSFEAFGEDLLLCVAEDQVEAYRHEYPAAKIDVHPADVLGTSAKRKWMYEKYGSLFMVDDDVAGQMIDFTTVPPGRLLPEEARAVIYRLGDMAEQMGASLWGVHGTGNPLLYSPQRPFEVRPHVILGCAMGLHPDEKLWFPEDRHAFEDIWISGLNAYENRFVLHDLRYGLAATYGNAGGRASSTTSHALKAAKQQLRDAFGDAFDWPDDKWVGKLRCPW